MRVPQSYVQKCKATAHVFQALFIFIGGCIMIAVLTQAKEVGGAPKYYFALCFLTIPALIYLTMVPMWSRAVRFANAYAFLAVDLFYTIFWFAAFIAVAIWNAAGMREGAKDHKLDESAGNCTIWKWGPETACKLTQATTGFGVVIFIAFIITTAISSYYLIKYRKTGHMPYEAKTPDPYLATGDPSTLKDPSSNPWSTDIERHSSDSFDHNGHDTRTEHGGNQEEDEYALLHETETDEGRHPGRPLSWGSHERDNVIKPYAAYDDNHVSTLSPGGYEEYRSQTSPPAAAGAGAYGAPSYGAPTYGGERPAASTVGNGRFSFGGEERI